MRLPTFYEQNLIPNWGIKCAYLDKALFNYLENDGCRAKLKEVLIANYITV